MANFPNLDNALTVQAMPWLLSGDQATGIRGTTFAVNDFIQNMADSTNLDLEKWAMERAIEIAKPDMKAHLRKAKSGLTNVTAIAKNRAKFTAWQLEGGFASALPRMYKERMITKSFQDGYEEGMMLWGLMYPYAGQIMAAGNFARSNPILSTA